MPTTKPIHPAITRDYKYRQLSTSPYHQMAIQLLEAYMKHMSAAKRVLDDNEFRKLYNRFYSFVLTAEMKQRILVKTAAISDDALLDLHQGRRIIRNIKRAALRNADVQLELNDVEKIQRLLKKMTRQDDPVSARVELSLQLMEYAVSDSLLSHPMTVIHDFDTIYRATEKWIPMNAASITSILPEINVVKNPVSVAGFEKTGADPKSVQSRSRGVGAGITPG